MERAGKMIEKAVKRVGWSSLISLLSMSRKLGQFLTSRCWLRSTRWDVLSVRRLLISLQLGLAAAVVARSGVLENPFHTAHHLLEVVIRPPRLLRELLVVEGRTLEAGLERPFRMKVLLAEPDWRL